MENGSEAGESKQEWIPYVEAAALGSMNGRRVRMWGRIEGASNDSVVFRALDGADVSVRLKNGDSPSRLPGLVEAIGTAQGRMLTAAELVPFTPEQSSDTDSANHIALARILSALDDPWNLGEDQLS